MRRAQAEGFKGLAQYGEVGTMPLRGLAALLLLGGIVYALLSGNWGIGAIAFGLGAGARQASCGGQPARARHRVGARSVRRVNNDVHRNQDGGRRNIGSFSAWCAMNFRESPF
jgi:hypothetical protein